jgi:hypothetical protein
VTVTLRTERPPVRPRSGRRPLPPLIFLLVLALAALATWWYVLRQEDQKATQEEQACQSAENAAPPSLDPATVHLRVLNATETAGLATTVGTSFTERGFVVDEVANDTSGREVTGVGELRHGPRGTDPAAFVRVYIPNSTDFQDTRADATVDVVLGPEFTTLASAEDVTAALTPPENTDACQ